MEFCAFCSGFSDSHQNTAVCPDRQVPRCWYGPLWTGSSQHGRVKNVIRRRSTSRPCLLVLTFSAVGGGRFASSSRKYALIGEHLGTSHLGFIRPTLDGRRVLHWHTADRTWGRLRRTFNGCATRRTDIRCAQRYSDRAVTVAERAIARNAFRVIRAKVRSAS